MGFKTDASFLRYLTMGALGARHVINELQALGFEPIELERYATSNKIWSTKIKRLRLPDILCVRTGLRVEVRAKSNLEIRMSHAPGNADRYWDAGLRDEDIVAIIVCYDQRGGPAIQGHSNFFRVQALRHAVDDKQLSRLKSASEGSEQHLTWPSIVSRRAGKVLSVDSERLIVEWGGDGKSVRRYGYALGGKLPYVASGRIFPAETIFLAGTPSGPADLRPYLRQNYAPLIGLKSGVAGDRYAAAKALPFWANLRAPAKRALEARIGTETDIRMALEVANGAAALGSAAGLDFIQSVIWEGVDAAMRMEAIFITTELARAKLAKSHVDALTSIASDSTRFVGDEARQAAVWGLGRAGVRAYERLLPYLADPEENVVLHAIAAYGSDTPSTVIAALVSGILNWDAAPAAAAAESLRTIATAQVLEQLIKAAKTTHVRRAWIIATIGRLPAHIVHPRLNGTALFTEIEPILLISPGGSWLSEEDTNASLRFLEKQNL